MPLPDLAALDAWLAAREAQVPGLRPGCARAIRWAGPPGARRHTALVYVHGFSASPRELSPLPERVAEAWGANLHFARLTGHGQDGAALAAARLADWQGDVAEALAIGAALGERVVLMGNSTGSTLIALAAAAGAEMAGLVMVAPNFALRDRTAQFVMGLPGAGTWAPWLFGRMREFEVISPAHAAYWTPRYPTRAVMPVGEAVRAARRADFGAVRVPALFVYSPADEIVDPGATRAVMARWGGPAAAHEVTLGPGDDARAHVIAGEVFSPGQTDALARIIADWGRAQGLAG